jgi:lysophospholipase L1-like esterase
MSRLLAFVATTGVLLAGGAVLNWWVDPFGEFWKPAAVQQARASRPPCLVSHEVIGGQYLPFKLDVFRSRPTRTFVTGSSRVLKISAWPGEQTFANLGMPIISPEIVLRELRALPARPAQTMFLGVEAFWFNPRFHGFGVEPGLDAKARYVLSRSALEESVRILRHAPYVLLHRWRKERVGPACVIGRERPALAWKLDGSRVWSFELDPRTYHPLPDPFTTDLRALRTGIYAGWTELSSRRVRIVRQILELAQARGWRVVGFTPPDGTRYLRFFETQPVIGPRWREFGSLMPGLFHRYGFTWLDFRDPRAIPCRDGDFVDGGYHTNASCSMRMRARLDDAAAGGGRSPLTVVALGDSIPAATARECECTLGFVDLFARALAHAAGRPTRVWNLAVPGASSGDLRTSLARDATLRTAIEHADAVIVAIGHNDTPWLEPGGSSARLRGNLDAVLTRIHELRERRPTLLRVANFHDDRSNDPAARRVVAAYARTICSVAARQRAACVHVHRAFATSGRGILASDGIHPSQAGHRLIAELLVKLGFAPLVPANG